MVHERAGASPNFSKYHKIAIKEALQGRNFSDVIIHDENYPDSVWEKFVELTDKRPNEKLTRGVIDLLENSDKKGNLT